MYLESYLKIHLLRKKSRWLACYLCASGGAAPGQGGEPAEPPQLACHPQAVPHPGHTAALAGECPACALGSAPHIGLPSLQWKVAAGRDGSLPCTLLAPPLPLRGRSTPRRLIVPHPHPSLYTLLDLRGSVFASPRAAVTSHQNLVA